MNVFADKIVDIAFFFQFSQLHCRAGKFLHAGAHRFLMFADLALVKEVFRYQDQVRGIWVILIFKAGSPENLRVIEPQFKKYIA